MSKVTGPAGRRAPEIDGEVRECRWDPAAGWLAVVGAARGTEQGDDGEGSDHERA
jgi:hypothetical protein